MSAKYVFPVFPNWCVVHDQQSMNQSKPGQLTHLGMKKARMLQTMLIAYFGYSKTNMWYWILSGKKNNLLNNYAWKQRVLCTLKPIQKVLCYLLYSHYFFLAFHRDQLDLTYPTISIVIIMAPGTLSSLCFYFLLLVSWFLQLPTSESTYCMPPPTACQPISSLGPPQVTAMSSGHR